MHMPERYLFLKSLNICRWNLFPEAGSDGETVKLQFGKTTT